MIFTYIFTNYLQGAFKTFEKKSVNGLLLNVEHKVNYIRKMIKGNNLRCSLKTNSFPLAKELFYEIIKNSDYYRTKSSGRLFKLIDK